MTRPTRYNRQKNDEKVRILEVAKEIGVRKAARLFSVDKSNVQRWLKQEKELKTTIGNQKGQMKEDFSNIYTKYFIEVCLVIQATYYIKLFRGSDTFFWHYN